MDAQLRLPKPPPPPPPQQPGNRVQWQRRGSDHEPAKRKYVMVECGAPSPSAGFAQQDQPQQKQNFKQTSPAPSVPLSGNISPQISRENSVDFDELKYFFQP